MLNFINQFQKDAQKLERDPNSIEEFKMWIKADRLRDEIVKQIDAADALRAFIKYLYSDNVDDLLDDNPFIEETLGDSERGSVAMYSAEYKEFLKENPKYKSRGPRELYGGARTAANTSIQRAHAPLRKGGE